jgi:hypothetical protein
MTIEQSLAKPDSKIFTEDLKTLLYLTKGDSDLDLFLRALKKFDFFFNIELIIFFTIEKFFIKNKYQ